MLLTADEIAAAKAITVYTDASDIVHEHDDCIRIAYHWLEAQRRTGKPQRGSRALKHVIEAWGGRYVSRNDVEVAAVMVGLKGCYPRYNISRALTLPSPKRLLVIGQAGTQLNYRERNHGEMYKHRENA